MCPQTNCADRATIQCQSMHKAGVVAPSSALDEHCTKPICRQNAFAPVRRTCAFMSVSVERAQAYDVNIYDIFRVRTPHTRSSTCAAHKHDVYIRTTIVLPYMHMNVGAIVRSARVSNAHGGRLDRELWHRHISVLRSEPTATRTRMPSTHIGVDAETHRDDDDDAECPSTKSATKLGRHSIIMRLHARARTLARLLIVSRAREHRLFVWQTGQNAFCRMRMLLGEGDPRICLLCVCV